MVTECLWKKENTKFENTRSSSFENLKTRRKSITTIKDKIFFTQQPTNSEIIHFSSYIKNCNKYCWNLFWLIKDASSSHLPQPLSAVSISFLYFLRELGSLSNPCCHYPLALRSDSNLLSSGSYPNLAHSRHYTHFYFHLHFQQFFTFLN